MLPVRVYGRAKFQVGFAAEPLNFLLEPQHIGDHGFALRLAAVEIDLAVELPGQLHQLSGQFGHYPKGGAEDHQPVVDVREIEPRQHAHQAAEGATADARMPCLRQRAKMRVHVRLQRISQKTAVLPAFADAEFVPEGGGKFAHPPVVGVVDGDYDEVARTALAHGGELFVYPPAAVGGVVVVEVLPVL